MSNNTLVILLSRTFTTPGILAKIRAMSPRIDIIFTDELQEHPELVERVEVSFGRIPWEFWARAERLRWLQTFGAGVDGLLTPEVKAHPVVITNTRIHGDTISEHLIGMLLMFVRRLQDAYRLQLQHHWGLDADEVRFPRPGDAGRLQQQNPAGEMRQLEMLPGKTLGLVGVGNIGRRTAELAKAFGLHVLGMRYSGQPVMHVDEMYTPAQKADMFPRCDFLMLTIPLTPHTHHFIGAAELALLPPHAYLFNIGRGKVVDTDALMDALRTGRLAGAGLDVVDPEPLPADHPLWDFPNVIITPHNAGLHVDYADHAGTFFLENLRRYLDGETLVNVVDKARGY